MQDDCSARHLQPIHMACCVRMSQYIPATCCSVILWLSRETKQLNGSEERRACSMIQTGRRRGKNTTYYCVAFQSENNKSPQDLVQVLK